MHMNFMETKWPSLAYQSAERITQEADLFF